MQEALGFLLAQLSAGSSSAPTASRASPPTSTRRSRVETPADRRDVAWATSDDFVRVAQIDRADGRAHFAQRRRRRAGGGAASAWRDAGARLGRARRPQPPQGRRAGDARTAARSSKSGASVAMTADVAKRARVAGLGIVTLARLSGRPIAPTAVVASRRFDFNSWDRASLGKPFGRGAIVVGDLIHVAARRRRRRRWRRRGARSRTGSTRCTRAPMRWSARAIPART